jgi:hypothetical protein
MLMSNIMCLHASTQEEDILDQLMPSGHYSQLEGHCVTHATPHSNVEHTHAKILVSVLERQVS